MKTLEETLEKIEGLQADAFAYKVIQPEASDWDIRNLMVEPDIEKIEKARLELKEVYLHSEWYSARYAAGSILGKDSTKDISAWCADLEKRLWANNKEERTITGDVLPDGPSWARSENVQEIFTLVDKEERSKALDDTIKLLEQSSSEKVMQLLRKVYKSSVENLLAGVYENVDEYGKPLHEQFVETMREKAGKALGYSQIRVLARNDPFGAIITGIAAVGAASGLIYALAGYFGK